ncbi:holo-ACP synthase [Tyzzerella sp. OttesenSCG-928-J15]|nr:holo-ACP synthase [Tyzzerella sp. OttesenSCG-928-J15]
MVLGIGCDIIEIERVKKAVEKENFLQRYFTDGEISLIAKKGANTAAGNFCVKEAVVKAFGTGFGNIMPKDIEVLRDENGKPYVKLYNAAQDTFNQLGATQILVTISHSRENAIAYVVIE